MDWLKVVSTYTNINDQTIKMPLEMCGVEDSNLDKFMITILEAINNLIRACLL